MKRNSTEFYILTKFDGLVKVYGSTYDDYTFFLPSNAKENEHLKNVCGYASGDYFLIDKQTGLSVCYSAKLRDLSGKYLSVEEKYRNHRKSDKYPVQIEEYRLKMAEILKD